MRCIINADDLGISEVVNSAIFELMDRGLITSATVMANGPAVEQAARQLGQFPHCSFGVHLNLTAFESLSRHPGFGDYLDADGRFRGDIRRRRIRTSFKSAVHAEWTTQVRRALELGVPISHFDSHHHVHTIPALLRPLKALQREFGIQRVRISRNLYRTSTPRVRLLQIGKSFWNFALRHYGPTRTTDVFGSLADFYAFSQDATPRFCNIELMVHPGDPHFDPETNLLAGAWKQHVAEPVELISYNSL